MIPPSMEKTDQHVKFRPARRDDADNAVPLVFASGKQEFGYLFGVAPDVCVAFLRGAFASPHGRFSWRRHWVATTDSGIVVATLAAHGSQSTLQDNVCFAWMSLRFFGLRRTFGILRRGLTLESELPPPRCDETLLAHCATGEVTRGHGVFSALLNASQTSEATPSKPRSSRLRVWRPPSSAIMC